MAASKTEFSQPTLRCQINGGGGQNKRGGGKFLKILINGGIKINGGGGNFLKNLINI